MRPGSIERSMGHACSIPRGTYTTPVPTRDVGGRILTPLEPGYPPRYYQQRYSGWGCIALGVAILGSFAALLTASLWVGSVHGLWWDDRPGLWLGVAALLTLAWVVSMGVAVVRGWIRSSREVRIIPYYDRPLPQADTFLSGLALARNCLHLDRLARARGVRAISDFGFNDPLRGEQVVWHDAKTGLPTITALLRAVAEEPDAVDDAAAVSGELEKIRHAFERASTSGIRFAFLVEIGSGTSGQVWEVRGGYI